MFSLLESISQHYKFQYQHRATLFIVISIECNLFCALFPFLILRIGLGCMICICTYLCPSSALLPAHNSLACVPWLLLFRIFCVRVSSNVQAFDLWLSYSLLYVGWFQPHAQILSNVLCAFSCNVMLKLFLMCYSAFTCNAMLKFFLMCSSAFSCNVMLKFF